MNSIPIKNIYYLILYAFGAVKNKENLNTKGLETSSSFNDVLIKIFLHEVEKIIRTGIYHDYDLIDEDTLFIKGKINIKESLINPNQKNRCSFDEFNNNHVCNKIIKYTLNRLLFENSIEDDLKKKIRINYFYFESVPLMEFSANDIKSIQLNRLNSHYQIALKFALFLNHELIPKNVKGTFDFIHIFENEETMSRIYEQFLFNYYEVNLDNVYHVKGGSKFNWELYRDDKQESNLPMMETDIEIRRDNALIVIDAKYYTNAFSSRFEVEKFRSSHLYQMNSYLNYYENKYEKVRGILVYPSNGYSFYERYKRNDSFGIEFATIDLSKDWDMIDHDLMRLIDWLEITQNIKGIYKGLEEKWRK